MDIDSQTTKKIQEFQALEQNLQNFLAHKQSIQLELNEITNALNELKISDDEVYKIISGIMLKSKKENLKKDLEEKKKLLELRISSIEKQEALLEQHTSKLREEINDSLSKKEKK